MKKLIYIQLTIIVLFSLIWIGSIIKIEIDTYRYGSEFAHLYKETTITHVDFLKVLDYSDTSARVYFVSKGGTGDIISATNQEGKWVFEKWETTVWSASGNANGFVWPYIHHSAEGIALCLLFIIPFLCVTFIFWIINLSKKVNGKNGFPSQQS